MLLPGGVSSGVSSGVSHGVPCRVPSKAPRGASGGVSLGLTRGVPSRPSSQLFGKLSNRWACRLDGQRVRLQYGVLPSRFVWLAG